MMLQNFLGGFYSWVRGGDEKWNDWFSRPDAPLQANRAVDTPAQTAEIEPLLEY